MRTRTRYSFGGMPGTYERGRTVRERLDALIAEAGGVCSYMRGARAIVDKGATMTGEGVRTGDKRLQGRIQGRL